MNEFSDAVVFPSMKQIITILHQEMYTPRIPRSGSQQGRERVPRSMREQILRGQSEGQREDAGRGGAEGHGWWRDGRVWDVKSCSGNGVELLGVAESWNMSKDEV